MRSRIIDKEQAGAADRWDVPSVDASAADALRGAYKGSAHLLTAGQLDALQKQVHEEAFRRGFEEGLAAGKAELASRVARLAALAESFSQPFQNLESSIEDELVNLSVELASHLVRHEIAHDPAQLHAAINDCLGVLASTVRDVTLHLHPDDAALIRADIKAGTETRFTVAEDAALQRGDLRITSGSALVDGRLSARCAEIIAAARAG
ncbi:MAG TPA: FliH/SctL family protein [Gammaproteobacteria bacterium]|nr:FliH/SctL family protein [Gammaproteobacteria bacterium]